MIWRCGGGGSGGGGGGDLNFLVRLKRWKTISAKSSLSLSLSFSLLYTRTYSHFCSLSFRLFHTNLMANKWRLVGQGRPSQCQASFASRVGSKCVIWVIYVLVVGTGINSRGDRLATQKALPPIKYWRLWLLVTFWVRLFLFFLSHSLSFTHTPSLSLALSCALLRSLALSVSFSLFLASKQLRNFLTKI